MNQVEILSEVEELAFIAGLDPIGDHLRGRESAPDGKICGATEWKQRRNGLAGLLMVEAGLRVGELVRLIYQDCFFAGKPARTLTIRPEVAKGGHERKVPLTDRIQVALERYLEEFYRGVESVMVGRMFTRSQFGRPMTERGIEKIIQNAGLALLNRRVYPHMLRHTFATKLMRVTDIRTVQVILGHRNLASTQVYLHPNSNDADLAIREMQNLSGGVGGQVVGADPGDSVSITGKNGGGVDLQGSNKGEMDNLPGKNVE